MERQMSPVYDCLRRVSVRYILIRSTSAVWYSWSTWPATVSFRSCFSIEGRTRQELIVRRLGRVSGWCPGCRAVGCACECCSGRKSSIACHTRSGPGTMGGLRHGKAETALRAAPTERGVYTRLMRLCSLCAGTKAGTKLVLCHRQCVLCSPLVMPRWRVPRGRGVLCHRSRAA
jgi:hypothetical protein